MGAEKVAGVTDSLFENYINIEQLSNLIGRKPQTIRNWCSQRKIPFVKVGSRTLFSRSSIDAWLASKEVKIVKRRF